MTDTMYMHYRAINTNPVESIDPRGGATIAIRHVDDTKALASIAFCNPGEVFNKKIGRYVAAGRLSAKMSGKDVNGWFVEVPIDGKLPTKAAVDEQVRQSMEAMGYY